MSHIKDQLLEKRSRRKTDGTGARVADYKLADARLLREAVEAITARGGAIRFGRTRDGGAYAIGIYSGGEHNTEYCPATEDINDWLRNFIDDVDQVPTVAESVANLPIGGKRAKKGGDAPLASPRVDESQKRLPGL